MQARKPGLLVLSFDYPPVTNPTGIQISRLAEHLNQPVTVLCSQPHGPNQDDSLEVNLDKLRGDFYLARMQYTPPRIPWIYEKLGLSFMVTQLPDEQRSWSRRATAACLKLHRENPGMFQALMTVGPPFSDHLAGLTVTRLSGLPWLVYWGDDAPQERDKNLKPYAQKFRRRSESMVFNLAHRVIFQSEFVMEETLRPYGPEIRKKARVLPPSFNPAYYKGKEISNSYTILLRPGMVNLETWNSFLSVLSRLFTANENLFQNLEIHLLDDSPDFKTSLEKHPALASIFKTKNLNYLDTLKALKQYSCLVHIENRSFSAKSHSELVDSLGTGKPTIFLGPNGAMGTFCQSHGGQNLSMENEESLMVGLARILSDRSKSNSQGLPPLDSQTASHQFQTILDEVVKFNTR